jgi:serine/threonine-protein kinase HipA
MIIEIKVGLNFGSEIQSVGRLAERNGIIYFEYDEEFIQNKVEISPFKLPLKRGVVELPSDPFEGLAGVFSDSLPDGWGRLLFDRLIRSKGISPTEISSLDRLG